MVIREIHSRVAEPGTPSAEEPEIMLTLVELTLIVKDKLPLLMASDMEFFTWVAFGID